jgi:superoxide oxidase
MSLSSGSPRFSLFIISIHWLTLMLFIGIYTTIEIQEFYEKGSTLRTLLKQWHTVLGLSVLFLVVPRLIGRLLTPTPPIEPPLSPMTALVAHATHLALYGFMIFMPLIGWGIANANGREALFMGFALPRLVAENNDTAELLLDLHTWGGWFGYAMIGAHAGAALLHHYVTKDNVLARMTFMKKPALKKPQK